MVFCYFYKPIRKKNGFLYSGSSFVALFKAVRLINGLTAGGQIVTSLLKTRDYIIIIILHSDVFPDWCQVN